MSDGYETGYFGVPGGYGGMVHVARNGKPVCGTRMHKKAVFQWCSTVINWNMTECKSCRKWINKFSAKEKPCRNVTRF